MANYDVIEGSPSTGLILNNDSMFVSNGGTANNTIVNEAGYCYVSEGGIANDTTVNSMGILINSGGELNNTIINGYGQCHVSGGTANNTTVNSVGVLYVYDGATAEVATVKGYGEINVSKGGTVNNAEVNNLGYLDVYDGGTVNTATVNSDGACTVSEGGSANSVTVNIYGSCDVYNGGKATNIKENGGFVYVEDGADVTFAPRIIDGLHLYNFLSTTVHAGTTATDTFVDPSGELIIYSGGKATNIKENGGFVDVKDGADVTFASNTINELYFWKYQSTTVHEGTTITNAIVTTGGTLEVYSGGKVVQLEEKGGFVYVEDGAEVTFVPNTIDGLVVSSYLSASIHNGTTVRDIIVSEGGGLYLYNGGKLTGRMSIESGATVVASNGAVLDFDLTATTQIADALLNNMAAIKFVDDPVITLTVGDTQEEGGYKLAEGASEFSGAITVVNTSGTVLGTITVADGTQEIGGVKYTLLRTGSLLSVEVGDYRSDADFTGDLTNKYTLSAGSFASGVNVNEGGTLRISSGAVASNTTINDSGIVYVFESGKANLTTVNTGGKIYVYNGGKATSIRENGGFVHVADGAAVTFAPNTISGLLLLNNQDATIHSGTTALNTTVNDGAYLYLSSGGKLTGRTTVEAGAKIYCYASAIVDFDLTQTSPGAEALINNFSVIELTPTFTITVSGTAAYGEYTLAKGVAGFNKTITVMNTSGAELGTISIEDGTKEIGDMKYTLNLNDSILSVTLAKKDVIVTGDLTSLVTITSGMIARDVNVNTAGTLYLASGGIASNTAANDFGYIHVANGGSAENTTVNDGAWLFLSSGGSMENVTVNSGGRLIVFSGGKATEIIENGGYVSVGNGAEVTFTPNTINGLTLDKVATIHSGTTATNTTVNPDGYLYVSSGGTATEVMENGGYVSVADGAEVTFTPNSFDNLTLDLGKNATVHSGTTATNITVDPTGVIFVFSGGTAQVKENGGYVDVKDGADVTFVKNTFSGVFKDYPATIHSGTTATDTTLDSGANFFVYDGGSAIHTQIKSAGSLNLLSGGRADNTTINSGGRLFVSSGGTATVAEAEGTIVVYKGGFASGVTIYMTGRLYAFDGGTANQTTVTQDGYFCVSAGGQASGVTVDPLGSVYVASGCSADGIAAANGARVNFHVASNTYVHGNSGGSGFEMKDALLSGYTVISSGNIYIDSGAVACETTVDYRGGVKIYSGGLLEETTVKNGGSVTVTQNGSANHFTVKNGGSLRVYYDGKVTGRMTIETGATVTIDEDGILDFDLTRHAPDAASLVNDISLVTGTPTYTLTVDGNQTNGIYKLADGAAGFSKTITVMNPFGTDMGTLAVGGDSVIVGSQQYSLKLNESNLFVEVVTASGSDDLFIGDVTSETKIIPSGMSAIANVNMDGILLIENNGHVINTTINDGGELVVSSGGTLNGLTVGQGGQATICSSVVASSVVVNGGEMYLESGAEASRLSGAFYISGNTTVTNSGKLVVSSGGKVIGVKVMDGGHVVLEENAKLSIADITSAEIEVRKDAVADAVTVKDGGILNVASGGVIKKVTLWDGGIITGILRNASGLKLSGTLELNLTDASPDNEILVDAVSYGAIEDSIVYRYSVTLKLGDSQADGTYNLIEGAEGFDKTLTVKNTVGTELGTLIIGKTTNINGQDFTLNMGMDNNLTVTLKDTAKPVVSNVKADITGPTNGSVTVTADFTDNVGVVSSLFKVGDGEWTDYLASGVTVNDNTTVCFKAVDAAGNMSDEVGYAVSNIDKVKPTVSGITPSTSDPAASVTITATFDDNVGLASKQFKIGEGEWTAYPIDGVTVNDNTTVYFKAVDVAGNVSEEVSYAVSNIDNVKPTISDITPSTTDVTDSVTVTANFADNVALASQQYKIGLGDWTDYTTGVTVTMNTTVYFKATDTAGNEETAQYVVTNIETSSPDTTKPTVTNVKADITAPTNQNVTVTADFSDDVALKSSLYKINDGEWTNYVDGVTMTESGTVYFKAVDTSDNESTEESYVVTNIDKVKPTISDVKANTTEPTDSVTVTANFADDVELASKQYKIGDGSWQDYVDGVVVTENTTVNFLAVDTAGNETNASYVVTNIDKSSPDITSPTITITPSTTEPTTSVTVSAVFSDDVAVATKQYRVGDGEWKDYTEPVPVTENVNVDFRATDTSGNATVENYLVTNIENEPENDKLYNKKTGWADSENIATFSVNEVVAGDSMVYLDKKGSVESEDGKYFNSVGRTGTVEDTADYAKIELAYGAALKFSVDSTIGGTFYVYEATQNKKGDLVATQRQKISVKAGKTSPAKLSTIYLEAGEYFVGMEAKLPAAKKNPEVSAYYNVQLTGTKYYEDADDGWNDHAYALDANGKEDKTKLNALLVSGASDFGRGATAIEPDTGKEWVGFSDATDYKMIRLENAVNLTLKFTASGKAKLAIWKVSTGKGGKITLTSKGSVTVKADKTGTIKAKFLDAGEYFVSVTSTDAKKGGDAYYSIAVDPATVFFDSNDDGKNNILYDKKAKSFYVEDANHHFETTTIGTETKVKLDTDPVADTDWENFVGYQDATDYAKIKLTSDGKLNFHLEASGDATFTVYKKGQDKKGNDTLETIQTAKLAVASGASKTEKDIQISDLAAGEYYVSMAAKSTKANSSGSVFYNVTATLDAVVTSALEMPMAAAAYADSVQDKLFGETGNGLLASL